MILCSSGQYPSPAWMWCPHQCQTEEIQGRSAASVFAGLRPRDRDPNLECLCCLCFRRMKRGISEEGQRSVEGEETETRQSVTQDVAGFSCEPHFLDRGHAQVRVVARPRGDPIFPFSAHSLFSETKKKTSKRRMYLWLACQSSPHKQENTWPSTLQAARTSSYTVPHVKTGRDKLCGF
jgi:hypothetical protein